MNYQFDFASVIDGLPDLLWGCAGTLGLALSGMVQALVIGIGGVMLRDSRIPALRWLVMSFVEAIEMGFARQVADRLIFMADGSIVEEVVLETFFRSPQHDRTKKFLGEILPQH